MNKTLAIIPGDGIGPEIMDQAMRVLEVIAQTSDYRREYQHGLAGGAAYEVHGEHFPVATQEICRESDAILFGSVGGPVHEQHLPKRHNSEKNTILAMRKLCNFYANIRPTVVYPLLAHLCPLRTDIAQSGIDIVIMRELLGDLYFGKHETMTEQGEQVARDECVYREHEVRRIAHQWFQAAMMRTRKLHSVDKANVLDSSKLWRAVVDEVAQQYPQVQYEHILVDNAAMQLILKPSQFDVVLCPNMFGDILSDEASTLAGSIGMMPSASCNEQGMWLYEPAGWSAPDIAGQDKANPIAQILCVAMMLEYTCQDVVIAQRIRQAVQDTLHAGYRTGDIWTGQSGEILVGTQAMGDQIVERLHQ